VYTLSAELRSIVGRHVEEPVRPLIYTCPLDQSKHNLIIILIDNTQVLLLCKTVNGDDDEDDDDDQCIGSKYVAAKQFDIKLILLLGLT
jgi:hypothetical protein